MEKLVRDRIPEIMEAAGVHCNYRIATDNEYSSALCTKLTEELDEFTQSVYNDDHVDYDAVEEAADVLTVMIAIIKNNYKELDVSVANILDAYNKKIIERGAFDKQIIAKFDR